MHRLWKYAMLESDKYEFGVLIQMGTNMAQNLHKYGSVPTTLAVAAKFEGCIRHKARVS